MSTMRHALVVGGGIGGLTAALMLQRAGMAVDVFESARQIRELGVGINLLPHCVRVLDGLGLLERLEQVSIATSDFSYYTRRGQLIWQEPRGRRAGYQWPQLSIHRGRLQGVLLEAALRSPDLRIHTGHHFQRFEQAGQRVRAVFLDRAGGTERSYEGDLLLGADGIHSAVRASLYPTDDPLRWRGTLLWRGLAEAPPFLSGTSMIIAGSSKQRFVAYPISPQTQPDRALINWAVELPAEGPLMIPNDWGREGRHEDFAPAFAEWRFPWLDIPALMWQTPVVYQFPMVDKDPLPRWSFENVTLLGDAAHPMYPVGSNGASQAILDAEALAGALAEEGQIAAALERYEQQRRPATAAIVQSNRQMGPDVVMDIVEERAPDGFTDLEAVIPRHEREEIAQRYMRTAGFDRDTVNRASQPPGATAPAPPPKPE
ncbi:MAG TPA: flavin-dependent oxidoreductase [Roseiflexaceae bacterium]|nr:flavin-dependent oxidoreductase [Roseiflexaceae bacterium]